MTTPTPHPDIRCVQTGGPSGPITQGQFSTKAVIFPGGHLAFVVDGRPIVGELLPQNRRAEQLREDHRAALDIAEAFDRAHGAAEGLR